MATETREGWRGYEQARAAILAGKATPRALWVIVSSDQQRDRYALKPSPWEGTGEYQQVDFDDAWGRLIKLPLDAPSLITLAKRAQA